MEVGGRAGRRLLLWALLALGAWALCRLLRAPVAQPASSPAPEPGAPAREGTAGTSRRVSPLAARAGRGRAAVTGRSRPGVRPAVIAGVALLMLAGGVAAAVGVRSDGSSKGAAMPLWSLGLGERVAAPLPAAWAPVLEAAHALSRPDPAADVVGSLTTLTPEGAPNIVLMADPVAARDARRWVRVRLGGGSRAGLGWVRRRALGRLTTVDSHLFVNLAARRLTLVRRGLVVLQAPVGVGTAGAPSPRGTFYVRSRLTRYASAFYGPVAFGLSARAPVLTDWPVAGAVGIHGTNLPRLVPGSVARGSIRLRNPDLRRLARLLPLGTPVTIR